MYESNVSNAEEETTIQTVIEDPMVNQEKGVSPKEPIVTTNEIDQSQLTPSTPMTSAKTCKFCGYNVRTGGRPKSKQSAHLFEHRRKCEMFQSCFDSKRRQCLICNDVIRPGSFLDEHFVTNHPEKLVYFNGSEEVTTDDEIPMLEIPAETTTIIENLKEEPEISVIEDEENSEIEASPLVNPDKNKLKEDPEISIVQEASPIQIVSSRSISTVQARILEDGEVKASQLYKCMFCKKIYLTEEFTLNHISHVHAISKHSLDELGLKIKTTSL